LLIWYSVKISEMGSVRLLTEPNRTEPTETGSVWTFRKVGSVRFGLDFLKNWIGSIRLRNTPIPKIDWNRNGNWSKLVSLELQILHIFIWVSNSIPAFFMINSNKLNSNSKSTAANASYNYNQKCNRFQFPFQGEEMEIELVLFRIIESLFWAKKKFELISIKVDTLIQSIVKVMITVWIHMITLLNSLNSKFSLF